MNGETTNEARATENADLLRLIKESKMEKRFGEWVPELEAGTSPISHTITDYQNILVIYFKNNVITSVVGRFRALLI